MTTHGRKQGAGMAILQDGDTVLQVAPVTDDRGPNCQFELALAGASHQPRQLLAEANHWARVEHAARDCASWEGRSTGQLLGAAARAAASCDAAGRCEHEVGDEEQGAANGPSKLQPVVAHAGDGCQGPTVGLPGGCREKEPAD